MKTVSTCLQEFVPYRSRNFEVSQEQLVKKQAKQFEPDPTN
jgi:hypothetical protein